MAEGVDGDRAVEVADGLLTALVKQVAQDSAGEAGVLVARARARLADLHARSESSARDVTPTTNTADLSDLPDGDEGATRS
ncbi:hypothetical protein [Lentzea sp. NBRC 102530]|uniref:hypothetical protein n=1 Tax=Lentzea sp. NBRC 102530 TaxID=3032201 RepID=UPI0025525E0A|nr:hypothetical protein [Lentzea sp. NBRC 102530]